MKTRKIRTFCRTTSIYPSIYSSGYNRNLLQVKASSQYKCFTLKENTKYTPLINVPKFGVYGAHNLINLTKILITFSWYSSLLTRIDLHSIKEYKIFILSIKSFDSIGRHRSYVYNHALGIALLQNCGMFILGLQFCFPEFNPNEKTSCIPRKI